MTLNLSIPEQNDLRPRITVCGVGGAGGNAVNNMIEKSLDGVDFVVANTDAQALQQSHANSKIQLGVKVTEGLGAGARASVGAAAAEESIEQIVDQLAGSHMCFITAGMGGGTGTGAAPIIAQAARELGVLTVGVVTKPFQFEGVKRMRQAEEGVDALQKMVDTLIIIPNQNLFRIATEKTTFTEAFSMADDVLYQGVKGVTDLMVRPGLINLDFADVRAVMDEMGKAMMGTGESDGEDRAIQSAEKAIANPLLDEISLKGARGVLINITGGYDLTLFELDEAANRIREEVDPEANIIVGSTLDPNLEGVMRVSVVATGIDAISKINPLSESSRDVSYYPPRKIITAEERTVVNSEVEQGNAGQDRELKENVSTTGPGLFESQNKLSRSEFDPYTAGKDNANQSINAADRSRNSVSSEDQIGISQSTPPGTPSQETLDRLRAAVSKSPNNQALSSQPMVASKNKEVKDKPRFGIGSLINKMAGTNPAEPIQNEPPKARPDISENKNNVEMDEANNHKEKIEVPAFLRRQAN
jgi:cell division protein FtsZ